MTYTERYIRFLHGVTGFILWLCRLFGGVFVLALLIYAGIHYSKGGMKSHHS